MPWYAQLQNFKNWKHVTLEIKPSILQSRHQHKFSVNVRAGIVGDFLIGPHILPPRLNGARYHDFLRNTVPVLLEPVRHKYFMHDGAPPHYSRNVRTLFNIRFGYR